MRIIKIRIDNEIKMEDYPFVVRDEYWDSVGNGVETFMRNQAYTENGDWIGDLNQAKMYVDKFGIKTFEKTNPDHCICSIGFNPDEQKWYGWSHRAIYGFEIGSEVKKGSCAYEPDNIDNFISDQINFWLKNEYHKDDYNYKIEGDSLILSCTFTDDVPNEKLRGTKYIHTSEIPSKYGKGEWVARTLEDAKQMAIDFANGVS